MDYSILFIMFFEMETLIMKLVGIHWRFYYFSIYM